MVWSLQRWTLQKVAMQQKAQHGGGLAEEIPESKKRQPFYRRCGHDLSVRRAELWGGLSTKLLIFFHGKEGEGKRFHRGGLQMQKSAFLICASPLCTGEWCAVTDSVTSWLRVEELCIDQTNGIQAGVEWLCLQFEHHVSYKQIIHVLNFHEVLKKAKQVKFNLYKNFGQNIYMPILLIY